MGYRLCDVNGDVWFDSSGYRGAELTQYHLWVLNCLPVNSLLININYRYVVGLITNILGNLGKLPSLIRL
jgi:hypothetical protein